MLNFTYFPLHNGHICLIFFSRAEEVAHFFISPGKSAMTVLHPG